MVLPDVNVLIYAFRVDSPHNALCRDWLARTIAGDAAFGISPLTLSAVARITTNRRSMTAPSTLGEVFTFCDGLMAAPNCHVLEPGDRHWAIFRQLCLDGNVTGPDLSDAWYAALAIEHGCEWISLDEDFAKFAGLKWSKPTA
jgi:hypothetical protein